MNEATWGVAGVQAAVTKALAVSFGVAASRIRLANPAFGARRRLASLPTSAAASPRLSRRLEASVTFDAIVSVPPAVSAAAVQSRMRSATSGAGLLALAAAANQQLASDVAAGLIPAPVPSVEVTVLMQATAATPAPAPPTEPQQPADKPASFAPFSSPLTAALVGVVVASLLAVGCFALRQTRSRRLAGGKVNAGAAALATSPDCSTGADGVASVGSIRIVAYEAKGPPSSWDPRISPRVQDSAMVPAPKKSLRDWCDDGPPPPNPAAGAGHATVRGPQNANARPARVAVVKMQTRDV
jgi:hypothetical protein